MRISAKFSSVIAVSFFAAVFFSGSNFAIATVSSVPIDDPLLDEISASINDDGSAVAATSGPSCFDYYHFQSVQVSVGTDRDKYVVGDKVVFSGELINENDYPVVDGYVFVRVSKDNPNYATEGRYVVDEFFGAEKIALDAKASKNVQFEWRIPAVSAGKYHADYFFSVGKKFNLGGLPFSNEVTIGGADLEIEANNGWFYFDRAGTQVNGEKYTHIGSWPSFDSGSSVTIVQPLRNTFKQSQKISVKYELYRWDSLLEDDKLSEKSEDVIVPANSSAVLSYTIPAVSEPVYYLKITATAGGEKSIVNIRVVSDLERSRLNYPAITKFPLAEGDAFTLFSCFHNSSGANSSGKVLLTLSDKDGQEVGKTEYAGVISSNMMVDKSELAAEKRYDYLNLKAVILDKDGKAVDSYETVYDCKAINSANCQKIYWPYYLGAAVILMLIGAAVWWSRRRHNDLPIVAAGFLILISAWYFQAPEPVSSAAIQSQAQTRTVTGSNTLTLGTSSDRRDILYWNASMIHTVSIDATTHGKNYSLAINDPISFTYSNVGTYNGVAGAWDTPYLGQDLYFDGSNKVRMNKLNPVLQYDTGFPVPAQRLNRYKVMAEYSGWGVDPAVYVSSDQTGVVSCSSAMNCKAVGYGTATLTANIALSWIQLYDAHIWWDPCSDHYWDLRYEDCGRDMSLQGNKVSLPATSISWTITVPAPAVNGACSATHYNCSAGTSISNVDGATAYTWSCQGSNGGTTASCSEAKSSSPVNGVCSTTHYNCSAGTSISNAQSATTYTWSCEGSNGGTTVSCSEAIGGGGGVCGNGTKEGTEQCDDGNTASGDGCSNICQTEGGGGGGSVCGNGTKEGTEQCDDGNTASGDGCSNTCQTEVCGNNTCDFGESCSACTSDCGTCPCTPNCVGKATGDLDGCGSLCGITTASITANGVVDRIIVAPNSSVALRSTCGNATSYSISNGANIFASGSYSSPVDTTVAPAVTTTYTLTCTKNSTSATASAKVSVFSSIIEN